MSVLLLTEDDVRRLLTMEVALGAVEDGLRKMALDEAMNIPRARTQTDHAMQHVMSAAAKSMGVMGYKAYATSRKGQHFHVGLFDGKTGMLLSLLQADYLGQVRTGAASGVATQYMARPEASEVGVFGSGKQARTQLQAVCKVRKIEHVQVYSPSEERRRQFAAQMSEICRTEVEPVPRPEMAAEDKDIIITATTSREPVLNGHWIAEGTHINAIGSNFLGKAELDVVTVRRCESIVVDSKDQARLEAGDFTQALEDGSIHWSDVHELGQVIVGRYAGRAHPQDVTLFKSLGIAVEDVAVAARVYAQALELGVGRPIDW
jgi:ornithine cyclodeaminase/alanine dehydrogenase-like protein (mu-crystallin family)